MPWKASSRVDTSRRMNIPTDMVKNTCVFFFSCNFSLQTRQKYFLIIYCDMMARFFFYQTLIRLPFLIKTNVTLLTRIYIIIYGQLTSN
jgi:hypothetical protein